MSTKATRIFLVDDDPDDRFLFEEALGEASPGIEFDSARDGMDALDKLQTAPVLPQLVFMDVNMPRMNGMDCLKALKQDLRLAQLEVFMYSTSSHYREVCKDLGASAYIEKPDDFGKLRDLLRTIVSDPESFKTAHP